MSSHSPISVTTHLKPVARLLTFAVALVIVIALPQFASDLANGQGQNSAKRSASSAAGNYSAQAHSAGRPLISREVR